MDSSSFQAARGSFHISFQPSGLLCRKSILASAGCLQLSSLPKLLPRLFGLYFGLLGLFDLLDLLDRLLWFPFSLLCCLLSFPLCLIDFLLQLISRIHCFLQFFGCLSGSLLITGGRVHLAYKLIACQV